MKVGDKIWLFSGNRRVYRKDGVEYSSPIYSEHFYQDTIDGETSRSWIVGKTKFSKKDTRGIFTDQEKEDAIWANDYRWKIVDSVGHCPVSILKKINELLKEQP